MQDCVFCKIVAGDIPADKIFEDDDVVAFLDIQPIRPGHTLVIPKKHATDLLTIESESLQKVTSVLPRIARAVMKGVDAEGFNVGINNGESAGQAVPHTHLHIIPRKSDDGLSPWEHHPYGDEDAKIVAEKIRSSL